MRTAALILTLVLAQAPATASINIEIVGPQEAWRAAGLSEREAAAHLLDRFSFGARPDDVDTVVGMGLDDWLEAQLASAFDDGSLDVRLEPLRAPEMTSTDIANTYINMGVAGYLARRDGVFGPNGEQEEGLAPRERRGRILNYMQEHGYRAVQELIGELYAQKVLRATYSENQLAEVMTDFWFNHFYVSTSDDQARPWVFAYERDAIRPHALGSFANMLEATAKHPAMLGYLDNNQSTAGPGAETTMDMAMADYFEAIGRPGGNQGRIMGGERNGINENYARELMELHTLGVDGGYTQADVEEVSRVLSGWTVMPPGHRNDAYMERMVRGEGLGFVVEGDFLFRADAHDAGEKRILGFEFPAGGGLEEGEAVLDILAAHPSTADFIAGKLASRFVADEPPAGLVDRLAAVFRESGGEVAALVRTLYESPEFWAEGSRRAKVKSPFEVAVSAVRALDADIRSPRDLMHWIERMGQPYYAYQAPTGWPDRAAAWVNTGSLLNRMNFGLALASGSVRGVSVDLRALNTFDGVFHEPESAAHALEVYGSLLLPGRPLDDTLRMLTPVLGSQEFAQRVGEAADAIPAESPHDGMGGNDMGGGMGGNDMGMDGGHGHHNQTEPGHPPSDPLAYIVGILLGSPEFQRR